MSWINHIAYNKGIRGEEPNKELAAELIEAESREGIKEISEHLFDKNKSIASDCLAVLYHVGYEKPELIEEYADTFLQLLTSKNNRMVWGSMIALSVITPLKPEGIFEHLDLILKTMKSGTLITEIHGINTLTRLALAEIRYKERILPVLYDYLEQCRPIDFAKRVETLLPLIENKEELAFFEMVIDKKSESLSDAQKKKLTAVINKYNKSAKTFSVTYVK